MCRFGARSRVAMRSPRPSRTRTAVPDGASETDESDDGAGALQSYHYHLPPELEYRVQPGHLVWVPFGSQEVQGFVLRLDGQCAGRDAARAAAGAAGASLDAGAARAGGVDCRLLRGPGVRGVAAVSAAWVACQAGQARRRARSSARSRSRGQAAMRVRRNAWPCWAATRTRVRRWRVSWRGRRRHLPAERDAVEAGAFGVSIRELRDAAGAKSLEPVRSLVEKGYRRGAG